MFRTDRVTASATIDGLTVIAEYDVSTGRLRIVKGREIYAEWLPPHSWVEIASVAGSDGWGTRPTESDLRLVIDDLIFSEKI
jgi:hypothetical protein